MSETFRCASSVFLPTYHLPPPPSLPPLVRFESFRFKVLTQCLVMSSSNWREGRIVHGQERRINGKSPRRVKRILLFPFRTRKSHAVYGSESNWNFNQIFTIFSLALIMFHTILKDLSHVKFGSFLLIKTFRTHIYT